MKTRILHLISSGNFGGPEKQILEHLKRLNHGKYQGYLGLFIDSPNADETITYFSSAGISHVKIPMSGTWDIRALFCLFRELKRLDIGLLCTHGYKATLMGHLAKRFLRIKTIAFSRGYTTENPKVAFFEWLERIVIGKQSGLIAVSYGQLEKLKILGVTPNRAWVVHNAVSVEHAREVQATSVPTRIRRKIGAPEASKIVVSSGRLSPEKGHRYLVDAIVRLPKQTGAVFVFCGDGACLEPLKRQAALLGVLDSCRFVGFRRDILEIYNAMDLLVLPSLTEGLPNVVLEAFSFAKPVVAAAVGGVPELVEDGVNGVLFQPGDVEELATAIQRCLDDPSWAKGLGTKALERVGSEFSFEQQNEKLMEIYDEVLGNG